MKLPEFVHDFESEMKIDREGVPSKKQTLILRDLMLLDVSSKEETIKSLVRSDYDVFPCHFIIFLLSCHQ